MKSLLNTFLGAANKISANPQAQVIKLIIPAALAVAATGLIVLIFRKKLKDARQKLDLVNKFAEAFQPDNSLEHNLIEFLNPIVDAVQADGYYFYLQGPNDQLVLKAMRHRCDDPSVGPSYSGIAGYGMEKYSPPLSLLLELPAGPQLIKLGEVPMFAIPIKGQQGLILAGPIKSISYRIIKYMSYLGQALQYPLAAVIEMNKMKYQFSSVAATGQAIRNLTGATVECENYQIPLLGLSLKMVDASGGCLIMSESNSSSVKIAAGINRETENLFSEDIETHRKLFKRVIGEKIVRLTTDTKGFELVPQYLVTMGVKEVVLLAVEGAWTNGVAVYWFAEPREHDEHRLTALAMLVKRMLETIEQRQMSSNMSTSYISTLKMLVDHVDNMEPYTVGHSVLISRYSGIIARELGLDAEEIKDVMLAGYFHDIGMVGLAGDVLFKEGRYTEIEQENMRLHSEVGASIIETTIGNPRVAMYVRQHHERWDGCGYPEGLRGEEISMGARIIAVADTFCAKLTGRKHRGPLSFEKALEILQNSARAQLDPTVINVLVNWFHKKQSSAKSGQKALGSCWEMRCCPSYIASGCPAYGKQNVNCWEIRDTLCAQHGNNCSSCMIFTEASSRSMGMPGIQEN